MPRPTRPRHLVLAAALVGAAACSGHRPGLDALPAQELAGHFTGGADGSWFRPCTLAAADSAWWVTFTGRAVAQRDSLGRAGLIPDGERRFVRWRAAVTEGGEIGPRGPGAPALLVREILLLRPPGPGDCSPAPGAAQAPRHAREVAGRPSIE